MTHVFLCPYSYKGSPCIKAVLPAARSRHVAMGERVFYSLARRTPDALQSLSRRAVELLNPQERLELTLAFLWACTPEGAMEVLRVAHELSAARIPLLPFLDVEEEAHHFAACATIQERLVYAVACFDELSPSDRRKLLREFERRLLR